MRTSPLILLAATACGCSATPPVDVSRNAIIGGQTDPGDLSVVMVYAMAGQKGAICTGEVVSPHVVMTAAHCVDPATVGNGFTFQIFLGTDANSPQVVAGASPWYSVKSTDYDHAFDPNQLQGGHDIAVVITNKALPVPPLTFSQIAPGVDDRGADLRLVGYGVDNGADQNGQSAGTKRQVTTQLGDWDDLLLYFGDANHNTCEGDSGGPAFLTRNGKEVIIGITSFGDQGCTQGGADTRVDRYTAFVNQYINQYDPGGVMPPPPDMAVAHAPVDMAQHGATPGHDLATHPRDLAGATGAIGDPCNTDNDCQLHGCAVFGGIGTCVVPCSNGANDCPDGTQCSPVNGENLCVAYYGGGSSHGCAVGAPASSSLAHLAVGALGLLALALALRRQRRA